MTTPEFGKIIKTQGARKTLSELSESFLVDVCGKRDGNRIYKITQAGIDFLDGKIAVPESWYPPNTPTEARVHECTRKFVHEMRAVRQKNQSVPTCVRTV